MVFWLHPFFFPSTCPWLFRHLSFFSQSLDCFPIFRLSLSFMLLWCCPLTLSLVVFGTPPALNIPLIFLASLISFWSPWLFSQMMAAHFFTSFFMYIKKSHILGCSILTQAPFQAPFQAPPQAPSQAHHCKKPPSEQAYCATITRVSLTTIKKSLEHSHTDWYNHVYFPAHSLPSLL